MVIHMGVYILILIFLVLTLFFRRYVVRIGKIKIIMSFLLSCMVLFIFASLRDVSVGADTRQYQIIFKLCEKENWSTLYTSHAYYQWFKLADNEIGYKIYNKLVSYIGTNPQIITMTNSFLLIFLIGVVIVKFSEDTWLSIFLFYTFCFFQTALNLTPSSIVSYYMFLLIPLIENNKGIKFIEASALGVMFHTSAVFFLPLYFFNKIKLNGKKIFIVFFASVLMIVFYSNILPYLTLILPDKYLWYITQSKSQASKELAVYFVQLIAIIICLFFLGIKKSKQFIENNNIMVWFFLYETIVYMLSTKLFIFTRGAFLFAPFTIIIIPKLISEIDNKKLKKTATALITLYGVLVYFVRISFNNVGTTMPYNFFWN